MDAQSTSSLAAGIGICFASATLSNLGLILIKSVVSTDEPDVSVASPRGPSAGDEDVPLPAFSGDGADPEGGTFQHPARRHSAYARLRNQSMLDDLNQTRLTSIKVLSRANLTWFAGLLTFVLGQILNLVSLSYLQQVVWAVLSLFSLVSNAFFSTVLLGEPFALRDLSSTALIIFGSVLVVLANSAALTADQAAFNPWTIPVFLDHFRRPWFLVYCSALATMLLLSVMHGVRAVGRGHTVHALTWTIISATSGSVSVLLGKCIVELIKLVANTPEGIRSPQARDLFASPSTYVILVIFFAAAVGALVSLNLALAVGEALLVVPWLTVVNTILAILGGVFYFEEFSSLRSPWRAVLFFSGVLCAILGSVLLQRGRVQSARRLSIDFPSPGEAAAPGEASHLLAGLNGATKRPALYLQGVASSPDDLVFTPHGSKSTEI